MQSPISTAKKFLVRPSKTAPAYLEANATSHTWPFSAIAELIDNAYEPDVKSSQIAINFETINGVKCLTFTDDGVGMDQDQLYKMLSFGYSDKKEDGYMPIGRYGNGFKSGSMRLGKDALVLTRNADTTSVGLLSQTYLKGVNADTVLIPIVSFSNKDHSLLSCDDSTEETKANLQAIYKWSMFKGRADLMNHVETVLNNRVLKITTGTKILIFNLKKLAAETSEETGDGEDSLSRDQFELQFDLENKDIINRTVLQGEPEYKKSLRKYCSILYLKPRMKIFILGAKVKQKLVAKDLCKITIDTYSPKWAGKNVIKITFGFNPLNNGMSREEYANSDYGIMIYNRNRLIQAFEKVGYQKQPNELGIGVVGVLEVDALVPIHNKQSFSLDQKYNSLMSSLAIKLNNYWDAKVPPKSSFDSGAETQEPENLTPDSTWAQCDTCLKWRRLPSNISEDSLPDKWHCEDNADANFNRCDIAEEKMEHGELNISYKNSAAAMKRKLIQNQARKRFKAGSFVLEKRNETLLKENANFQHQLTSAQKEREKYQQKLQKEKHRRRKSEMSFDNLERNIRSLSRRGQRLLADLSSDDLSLTTNQNSPSIMTANQNPEPMTSANREAAEERDNHVTNFKMSPVVDKEDNVDAGDRDSNVKDESDSEDEDVDGGIKVKCARCLCWRTIDDWPVMTNGQKVTNKDSWYCRMHPNQKIRDMCQTLDEIKAGIEVLPVEDIKKEEMVDLTQDGDDDDDPEKGDSTTDAEDDKDKKQNETVNALQNQIVDLRMKLKAVRRLTNQNQAAAHQQQRGTIKIEKLNTFVQTDLSMAYAANEDTFVDSSLASYAPPSLQNASFVGKSSNESSGDQPSESRDPQTESRDYLLVESCCDTTTVSSDEQQPTCDKNSTQPRGDVSYNQSESHIYAKSAELQRLAVELIKFCGVDDLEQRIDVNNTDHVTQMLRHIVANTGNDE